MAVFSARHVAATFAPVSRTEGNGSVTNCSLVRITDIPIRGYPRRLFLAFRACGRRVIRRFALRLLINGAKIRQWRIFSIASVSSILDLRDQLEASKTATDRRLKLLPP